MAAADLLNASVVDSSAGTRVLLPRGAYAFWIFDASGQVMSYVELPIYPRNVASSASGGGASPNSFASESIAEPLHAITDLLRDWLSMLAGGGRIGDGVKAFRSNHYKVHALCTQTGRKFILMTDPTYPTADGQAALARIYEEAFVDYVSGDVASEFPAVASGADGGAPVAMITNPSFRAKVIAILDDAQVR